MKTVKALFFDVDGTLLSFDTHRVPASALQALQQVHNDGCKLIIATGRARSDLREIEAIPYDAVIALNGSDCSLRDGTPILQKRISEEDFRESLALAQTYGFPVAIETDKGVFVNKQTPDVLQLAKLIDHPAPEVADLERLFAENACCQLCFYFDDETEKEVMRHLPRLAASRWHPIFADVNVKGIDKGIGIDAFANHYQIEVSQTMAFGDGGNDIPMLRKAGIGVAMGNASAQVKAAADYVTDEVDADGVQKALAHFQLI